MKERDNYLDFSRAVLILFIVFGHLAEGFWRSRPEQYSLLKDFWIIAYYFHIPSFAIISGFLSGPDGRNPDIEKLFRNLILPYIFFQILYRLYAFRIGFVTEPSFHFFSEPFTHLWYLLSLFFWRMLLPFFLNLKNALFLAFFAGVFSIFMPDASLFLGLGRTVRYFPYFLLGALLYENGFRTSQLKNMKLLITAAISLFAILLVHSFYKFDGEDMRVLYLFPGVNENHITALLHQIRIYSMGFILSAVFFILAAHISEYLKFIYFVGKYSLYPYVLHMFFVAFMLSGGHMARLGALTGYEWILIILLMGFSVLTSVVLATGVVRRISGYLLEPDSDFVRKYGAFIFTAGMILIFVLQNFSGDTIPFQ